jgi:hypothetical protein
VPTAFIVTAIWFVVLLTAEAVLVATSTYAAEAVIGVGVTLAVAPIALLLAWRAGGAAEGLREDVRNLTRAMDTITQESGLSEGAKRVLHRRQERELLRRAIDQDITDGDFDAAMVLVKELAERFGYRADAEEFRSRIERARAQSLDANVVESLSGLDELIRKRQWSDAYAEAARIRRLYPESHRVEGLRERVDQARGQYRTELERRFLQAAGREQIDEAMGLLKELDQYLTPTEAGPLQEVARGVVTKSRENLGVRFKLMLQDHQWSDAIDVGERIVSEFPNTKMAQEVRDLLPILHQRAGGAARPAEPPPPGG